MFFNCFISFDNILFKKLYCIIYIDIYIYIDIRAVKSIIIINIQQLIIYVRTVLCVFIHTYIFKKYM